MNGTINVKEKTFMYNNEEYYIPDDVLRDAEKFYQAMNKRGEDEIDAMMGDDEDGYVGDAVDTYLHEEWKNYQHRLVPTGRKNRPEAASLVTEESAVDVMKAALSKITGMLGDMGEAVKALVTSKTTTPSEVSAPEKSEGPAETVTAPLETREAMVDHHNQVRSEKKPEALAVLVNPDGTGADYAHSPLATLVSGYWYTPRHVAVVEGTRWNVNGKIYSAEKIHNYEHADATRFILRGTDPKKSLYTPSGYSALRIDQMNVAGVMVQKDPTSNPGVWRLHTRTGTIKGNSLHSFNTIMGDCGGPILIGNKFVGMHAGNTLSGETSENFYAAVSGTENVAGTGTVLQFFLRK